jgi:UDP-N-acetylmuramate dehydrogenase
MSAFVEALLKLEGQFAGMIRFSEPLARHTYYRLGGEAKALISPEGLEDVLALTDVIEHTGLPWFPLGSGSNVLASDEGYNGIIIKTLKINREISPLATSSVRVGASVGVPQLLREACKEGWIGFERFAGIPGTVGGMVRMNAGTHLGETSGLLTAVEAIVLSGPLAGKVVRYEKEDLDFSYRVNHFLPKESLVWAAEWTVEKGDPQVVKGLIQETLSRRKETQPVDQPSCGSVFKNPTESDKRAWQVIEELGLKGHSIGGAQFSDKHANFIVTNSSAKSLDVFQLIQLAKKRAKVELGISLTEEVQYLGF